MTKEINQMTQTEAMVMINSISEIMYKKFDISKNSIATFWNLVQLGAQTQAEKHAQQIDKLTSNPDVAYI